MNLTDAVINHFAVSGKTWPDVWRALAFVHTELAEVYELLLARDGGWQRNHAHEQFSPDRLAEELGDVLMMVLVAGIVAEVDPVVALLQKIAPDLEHREGTCEK